MEKDQQPNDEGGKRRSPERKKTKSKRAPLTLLPLADPDTTFPLLLAACLCGNSADQTLLTKCLKKLRLQILSKPHHDQLLLPLLSLLPTFLFSKNPKVACRGAEVVGVVSLNSLEMNERIAMDGETVRALVSVVGSSSRAVSMAACNSILDLCATSIGRQRLLECYALERLLHEFLQVSPSSTSVSLFSKGRPDVSHVRLAFTLDAYSVTVIHATIVLINACTVQQLEKISGKLFEPFMFFLRSLWPQVHGQVLVGTTLTAVQGTHFCLSNIRANELAESLFRLSINFRECAPLESATIKRRIFQDEATFETFMLSYWEAFPYYLRGPSDYVIENDDLFFHFAQNLNCPKASPTFLSSMLASFTSCPPMASDELDISHFLEETRMELGCPIIYQQDIRVVRTEMQSKKEQHFFDVISEPLGSSIHSFTMTDVMKCEEAYRGGYTIALRGMEFRLVSIALITDALSSLFGQPSTGANMYLTPSNSQGLARHFDDHCVFVFQLHGTKQWKIYPQLNFQLPCLYDSLSSQCHSDNKFSSAETMELLLKPGDMLYIPRGISHEACGGADAEFSLHLTFSIELEPAFEWEGFAHVALFCWNQMQSRHHHAAVVVSVNLLHAMIDHIGASDPTFRKACLVGALPLQLDSESRLNLNQGATFKHIINKIRTESSFPDVLRKVGVAIKEKKDPFHRMRWLRLLGADQETFEDSDWTPNFQGIQRLLPAYIQHKDMSEAAFMEVKYRFCSEVLFENAINQYKRLLDMYRKTRTQYTNGMVSLHCR